jgi:hypothetical protein
MRPAVVIASSGSGRAARLLAVVALAALAGWGCNKTPPTNFSVVWSPAGIPAPGELRWVTTDARDGDCVWNWWFDRTVQNPEWAIYRRSSGQCDSLDRRITAAEAALVRAGRVAELRSPQAQQSTMSVSSQAPFDALTFVGSDARDGDCYSSTQANPRFAVYRRSSGTCLPSERRITAAEAALVRAGRVAELKYPPTQQGAAPTPAPTPAPVVASSPPPPSPQLVALEIMDEDRIARSAANLREQPDATSTRLASLQPGERVTVTGRVRGSDWVQVKSRNGRTGYVLGNLLAIPEAKPPETITQVTAIQTPQASRPMPTQSVMVSTETRHALVIGNGEYRGLGRLKNPVSDARSVNASLTRLGFKVTTVENASREAMARAILDHSSRLRDGGTGLIFFAGHGMQVRGVNYLMPVEANPSREDELDVVAISLDWTLRTLSNSGNSANIVILDACRNNPLQQQVAFRSAMRGLAVVGAAPSNTLILYATAPNAEAADGDGANSIFTTELVRHIEAPGITVESMFKRVVAGVQQRSRGAQVPWSTGSMTVDIVLKQ